jgi:signal-transduction protein with cAMP-binding, CBS, and nucleotidyltransferase domain
MLNAGDDKMLTMRQLLESKGHQVWSVNAETSVLDALRLMSEKGIGALMVMEHSAICGIVSERDYARKVILEGRASHNTPVAAIMSRQVLHAMPEQLITEGMAVMTEHRVRHLPVMEHGHIIGIVSIGDLVKSIIAEQEYVITQMEHYISGAMA